MYKDLVEDLDGYSVEPDTFLDVPFVPTDEHVIRAMLQLGKVGPRDILYDLGSGEGGILIEAARQFGTQGVGIEIDPLRIADAMEFAADARVEHLIDFVEDNLFEADISEATVVTMYLLESVNIQLRPKLLKELRPGTRIISHAFHMGEWQPDEKLELSHITIFKWVVPAKIEGVWEWEGLDDRLYYVELQQKYQEVSGNAWVDNEPATLNRASLSGNWLELEIQAPNQAPVVFTLIVDDDDWEVVQHD